MSRLRGAALLLPVLLLAAELEAQSPAPDFDALAAEAAGRLAEYLRVRTVNPPGNEKARYQIAKESPEDPQEWLRLAETRHGSWWPDYASWLAERCGEERAAPGELGGGGLAPVGDAPGTYVYDH